MFRRLAHLLGFRKKDDALEKRFTQIKTRYLEAKSNASQETVGPVDHIRITGNFDKRTVIGASKQTKEQLTKSLLESCARAVNKE